VFQKLGDKAFEAFCRRLAAAYFRHEGRHEQALREVAAGLTIARERRLTDPLALLTISGALSEFELGRYVSARDHLREALRTESRQSAEARVHLARTHARLGETAAAAEELDRAAAAFVAMRPGIESPLLSLVRGEVALESGDRLGARPHFARAASLWRESDPDAYAAEARGRMGWLDVTDGRIDASRAHLQACVSMAARLGEFALQARCRVWLAEAALAARRLPDAAAMLTAAGVQDDGQTLGPELAAELQLSRARLLTAQGQSQAAARALADARAYVRTVADALSSPLREAYLSRPSIQVLDPR
jgi:tetratricopeptide (TPR) repeat protein